MTDYNPELDLARVLTRAEAAALIEATRAAIRRRDPYGPTDLAIVRLALGCGLRNAEIRAARLSDIVDGDQPYLIVGTKLKKGRVRRVPLWWDRDTYTDLLKIRDARLAGGAAPGDTIACTVGRSVDSYGGRIASIQKHWQRIKDRLASAELSATRSADLRLHDLRHTFATFALAAGRSLVDVQRALGHSNIALTQIYLHSLPPETDDNGKVKFGKLI